MYEEYPIPPISWDYLICAAGEDEVCKMTPVDCMRTRGKQLKKHVETAIEMRKYINAKRMKVSIQ